MSWRSGTVPVTGGVIAYHRTGGDGPPLVLSHGLTDSGLCWTRLASALEAEFDVIMLDARGHGASSRMSSLEPYDPGRDIAEAIEALRLESPVVMGHSVGARATAAYANAHPEQVAKVVLEDPPFTPLADPSAAGIRRRRFSEQVERFASMTDAEIIALGQATHPGWHADEFSAWANAKRQVDPAAMPTYAAPWQAQLDRITAPTLLIHGEAELGSLVTPTVAAEAARLNPNVQVAAIPGAGHNIRRENFQAYLAAVKAFLRSP
jgi:pimeloyl-ACP methyl ester carboxylesterase